MQNVSAYQKWVVEAGQNALRPSAMQEEVRMVLSKLEDDCGYAHLNDGIDRSSFSTAPAKDTTAAGIVVPREDENTGRGYVFTVEADSPKSVSYLSILQFERPAGGDTRFKRYDGNIPINSDVLARWDDDQGVKQDCYYELLHTVSDRAADDVRQLDERYEPPSAVSGTDV